MRPDGHPAWIAVRYTMLTVVVLLAAVPLYVFVEPSWRGPVARLASAFVLAVALLELRAALIRHLAQGGGSALDEARRRHPGEPDVPSRFLALVDDVRAAVRSRRHYEQVFWPRLSALLRRPPPPPPARRFWRGPRPSALQQTVAAMEKDP